MGSREKEGHRHKGDHAQAAWGLCIVDDKPNLTPSNAGNVVTGIGPALALVA
jgi:hypothetical protein